MARINKYLYEWDILVYYGHQYGYEVVCSEETKKQAQSIKRDYQREGYSAKIKKTRDGLNPLHPNYKEYLNNETN